MKTLTAEIKSAAFGPTASTNGMHDALVFYYHYYYFAWPSPEHRVEDTQLGNCCKCSKKRRLPARKSYTVGAENPTYETPFFFKKKGGRAPNLHHKAKPRLTRFTFI